MAHKTLNELYGMLAAEQRQANLTMSGEARKRVRNLKMRIAKREHHAALRSLGLKRVVGALGGVYYE